MSQELAGRVTAPRFIEVGVGAVSSRVWGTEGIILQLGAGSHLSSDGSSAASQLWEMLRSGESRKPDRAAGVWEVCASARASIQAHTRHVTAEAVGILEARRYTRRRYMRTPVACAKSQGAFRCSGTLAIVIIDVCRRDEAGGGAVLLSVCLTTRVMWRPIYVLVRWHEPRRH